MYPSLTTNKPLIYVTIYVQVVLLMSKDQRRSIALHVMNTSKGANSAMKTGVYVQNVGDIMNLMK